MDYFNLEAEGIKPNSMQRRVLKELRRNRDLGIKQAFLISSTGSGYTSWCWWLNFRCLHLLYKKYGFLFRKDMFLDINYINRNNCSGHSGAWTIYSKKVDK